MHKTLANLRGFFNFKFSCEVYAQGNDFYYGDCSTYGNNPGNGFSCGDVKHPQFGCGYGFQDGNGEGVDYKYYQPRQIFCLDIDYA